MTRKKTFPIIDLLIQDISAKGSGIGIYNHPAGVVWTVEVPFTIPGDFVRVKILKKRNGIHQSSLEEILTPSKQRQTPRCIHFGSCGGCRWQQLSYGDQLKWKEDHVRDCFKNILSSSVDFRTIVPCEKEWEYRNKMEFSFSQNLKGERFLGLMMGAGRGKVVDLTECHLVHRWFVEVLEAIRCWWGKSGLEAYYPNKDKGTLRTLTVRQGTHTADKMVMLTVSGNPDYALNKEQINGYVECIRRVVEQAYPGDQLSIFLRIQQAIKGSPTSFFEMHLYGPDHLRETMHVKISAEKPAEKLSFHISPSAFFQPNTQQAELFYSLALQMAGINKDSVVYDLYCGTGTIGLSIAKHAKQVVGIEVSPEAVLDAKANAALNGIKNYTVLCGDMRHVLKSIFEEKIIPLPNVLIIDPPRVGLDSVAIEYVLAFNAPLIVYISCNPKTQAVNVEEILKAGYALKSIQPVDQFPHTVHIENIVVLEKCK